MLFSCARGSGGDELLLALLDSPHGLLHLVGEVALQVLRAQPGGGQVERVLLAPAPERHRLERVLGAERGLLRRRVGVDEQVERGVELRRGRGGGGLHDQGEPVEQLDALGVELVLRDLRDQVVARNEQALALAVVALLRLLLVAADLVLLVGGLDRLGDVLGHGGSCVSGAILPVRYLSLY